MRESYRLNKHAAAGMIKAGTSVDIVFMYVGSRAMITFKGIKTAMERLVEIEFGRNGG